MSTGKILSVLGTLLLMSYVSLATTMDYVTIGGAGNSADSTGYGSVGYEYQIGKYEVTNTQYAEFLNAVAASDPNGVFNIYMQSNPDQNGLLRSGVDGSYTYSVKAGFANRPVALVTFWDTVRFANWMHNGQPTGAQTAATTEDGAYTLTGITDYKNSQIARNAGAQVWIPSEDEWYKAAYYNEAAGGYYYYPTSTHTAPTAELAPGGSNSINIRNSGGRLYSEWFTEVGAYTDTVSPCGAYDMAGNVWEFNDTVVKADSNGVVRGYRGAGANTSSVSSTAKTYRGNYYVQTGTASDMGFRIATIPEPATMVLLGVGGSLALLKRRRR